MNKKNVIALGLGSLAVVGLGYGIYSLSGQSSSSVDEKATIQTNFYQSINKEWLKMAEIPKDSPAQNAMVEINETIEERMKADVADLVSGKASSDLLGMSEFIEFYQLATDYEGRRKIGIEPLKPYLEKVESLSSIEELAQDIAQRTRDGLAQPFYLQIGQDLKDTTKKRMTLSAPGLFLLDASYYKDDATKQQLEKLFKESMEPVMVLVGYDEKEAKRIVEQALAFDSQIAPYSMTAEEQAEVENSYHLKSAAEVKAYSKVFDFSAAINDLVGKEVAEINVVTPGYFEAFDNLMTEKNLEAIKSWLLLNQTLSFAPYLTEDLRVAAGAFDRAVMGTTEPTSQEDDTFYLTTNLFGDTFSTFYGEKYFGKAAKEEVTQMIDEIVAVYRQRLASNTWLTAETKAKAIEKLDQMTYYVGYPEEIPEEVGMIDIDPKKSMIDNLVDYRRVTLTYQLEHFEEPVDKLGWITTSYTVNAFYRPDNNSISFPAGILNEPFYSSEQSHAQNYGAIGTVIGHEITHAFDNNGAKFDANGNLSDWWTEADYKAFEDKTQDMVALWDGISIYGGQVNGKLTVSENIADAGGLSASLEALQAVEKTNDLKPFFEQYAKMWRMKASPEYQQLMLTRDTHAPAELRVNMQLKNLDAFYETYDVNEKDQMYLPKDKRVSIW